MRQGQLWLWQAQTSATRSCSSRICSTVSQLSLQATRGDRFRRHLGPPLLLLLLLVQPPSPLVILPAQPLESLVSPFPPSSSDSPPYASPPPPPPPRPDPPHSPPSAAPPRSC